MENDILILCLRWMLLSRHFFDLDPLSSPGPVGFQGHFFVAVGILLEMILQLRFNFLPFGLYSFWVKL